LIAFLLGVAVAMFAARLMFPPAFAEEPATVERVPVLATQIDGTVAFKTVVLPLAPEHLIMHICIQEFEAAAIACYAINTTTIKWERFDLPLQP
jgi:hypothetical protein